MSATVRVGSTPMVRAQVDARVQAAVQDAVQNGGEVDNGDVASFVPASGAGPIKLSQTDIADVLSQVAGAKARAGTVTVTKVKASDVSSAVLSAFTSVMAGMPKPPPNVDADAKLIAERFFSRPHVYAVSFNDDDLDTYHGVVSVDEQTGRIDAVYGMNLGPNE